MEAPASEHLARIVEGNVCWTCKAGRFNKRSASAPDHSSGHCLEIVGNPPYDRAWHPPVQFWRDLESGFAKNFEDFKKRYAPVYYGDLFACGQIDEQKLESEFENMRWMTENAGSIVVVGWAHTCPSYRRQRSSPWRKHILLT